MPVFFIVPVLFIVVIPVPAPLFHHLSGFLLYLNAVFSGC